MECNGVLPITQFAYQKGLGTYHALFLSNRSSQHVRVDGRRSKLLDVVSGVPHSSVFGQRMGIGIMGFLG